MVTCSGVSDPVRRPVPSPPLQVAVPDPRSPLSEAFRQSVEQRLTDFVDAQVELAEPMGPEMAPLLSSARRLLVGGKRLRPAFCYWSYVAAGVEARDASAVLAAAASLELLHVSALVHDDVMDASDVRRGQPAAHRQFEVLHATSGWSGEPAAFGRAGAILLGDLLIMWSAEMMHACGLPSRLLARALPLLERMRTEVTCGQYLDMVAQVRPLRDELSESGPSVEDALDEARRVVEYKSARYTVQRPCQIGAALGGADDALLLALAAYGSPLGRAFQFRDDLLGVFGDPQVTGKPVGDDLREGKRTVLIAHAFARAAEAGRRTLRTLLGDRDLDQAGIHVLQDIIIDSGARDAVEAMISEGHERALGALEGTAISDDGRVALTALADLAVRRNA